MAGRLATKNDYTALTTLYAAALATAKAGWPGNRVYDGAPDWSAHRVYVSTDAQGIRFAITTRDAKVDFFRHSGASIHLDEENWLYVGPRSGLSASQNITATEECVRAWVNDCRARGKPDSTVLFGVVPATWNANFLSIYKTALACQFANLLAGEWPVAGNAAMIILFDTVANWDTHLKAQGQ